VAHRQEQGPEFELRIRAEAGGLQRVRHALGTWLEGQGATPEVGAEVSLAVQEAAANAVEHAYPRDAGDVIVRARHDDGRSSWSWRTKASGGRPAAPTSEDAGWR
jgi:serine/threonine-protein kinase RsbW